MLVLNADQIVLKRSGASPEQLAPLGALQGVLQGARSSNSKKRRFPAGVRAPGCRVRTAAPDAVRACGPGGESAPAGEKAFPRGGPRAASHGPSSGDRVSPGTVTGDGDAAPGSRHCSLPDGRWGAPARCHGLNACVPPSPCVEALISRRPVFGGD